MSWWNWAIAVSATLSQLLPPLAIRRTWRTTSAVRRIVAIWCLFFFFSDVLQIAVSRFRYNNHWLFVLIDPLEDAIILWALSLWQRSPLARLWVRTAIPLTVLGYVLIVFGAGEVDTFKQFGTAFRSLIVLSAALFTLISRGVDEPDGVWDKDWLWVSIGVALYYGLLVATDAFLEAVINEDLQLARAVITSKSLANIVVFLLVWRGLRCPLKDVYSGST